MVTIVKYDDILNAKQFTKIHLANKNIKKEEICNIIFNPNDDITLLLQQNNLFNPIKSYVIYQADFLSSSKLFDQSKHLLEIIKSLEKDFEIILLTDSKLLSNKEYKELTKSFDLIELKPIDENKKKEIVNNLLSQKNLKLDKQIYTHLLNSLDLNYGNIKNEIEKLFILSKTNASNDDYFRSISNYNTKKVYDLIEAVLFKNYDRSWSIYKDLMDQKEDEIYIINTISSQLFNIYYTLYLSSKNISQAKISEILGINIYFINIYKKRFINYNIGKLLEIIRDLYKLETKIKHSQVDKKISLKQFLLNI